LIRTENCGICLLMKAYIKRIGSSRYFRLALGVMISAVSLYLAFKNISIDEIWSVLSHTDLRLLVLVVFLVIANNLAKTLRWRVLMGEKGSNIHLGKTFISHLVGQTLNWLFPARLGDLSRAYWIGGMGPGRAFVLGTVVLEKMLDLIAYAALFVLLLLLIPLPDWVGQSGYALLTITGLVTLFVLLVTFKRERILKMLDRLLVLLPKRVRVFFRSNLDSGMSSLDVFKSRRDIIKVVLWTAIIWAAALLINHLVLLSLGINLPWKAPLLILIALQVSILIPAAPGSIGVFEYICMSALALFGIDQVEALSYGILLHAVVLIPMALLGLPFLGFLEFGEKHISQLRASEGGLR